MNIKLNCDMGEGFGIYTIGLDKEIMPLIDMVNLACGFHASDPVTMHKSIKMAKEQKVEIGAHPAYPDLVGFGRREMNCSQEEIVAFVLYQIGALDALCRSHGQKVTYVKPHGALYNSMMRDEAIFKAIAKAISKYDNAIKLMILSSSKNSEYETLAKKYHIELLYEVFADRAYTDEGFLLSRTQKGAVISNEEEVVARAKLLFEKNILKTIHGKELTLKVDSICVHCDNESALALIKLLHELKNEY
jgi:UPF0271 protein